MALWRRGPGEIFISYRRADSQTITERIYDRLAQEFGKEAVFKDLSSIPAGTDFPTFIRDRLRRARAVLVVIGPQWATMKNDAGELRLFQPDDAVRMEVAAALGKGAGFLVIPLLVSGASMPRAENLPPDLAALSTRNALLVRNDPDFDGDIRRLVETLAAETGAKPEARPAKKESGVARRWLLPMGLGALAVILVLCGVLARFASRPTPIIYPTATPPVFQPQPPASTPIPAPSSATPPEAGQPVKLGAIQSFIPPNGSVMQFGVPAGWYIYQSASPVCAELASAPAPVMMTAAGDVRARICAYSYADLGITTDRLPHPGDILEMFMTARMDLQDIQLTDRTATEPITIGGRILGRVNGRGYDLSTGAPVDVILSVVGSQSGYVSLYLWGNPQAMANGQGLLEALAGSVSY